MDPEDASPAPDAIPPPAPDSTPVAGEDDPEADSARRADEDANPAADGGTSTGRWTVDTSAVDGAVGLAGVGRADRETGASGTGEEILDRYLTRVRRKWWFVTGVLAVLVGVGAFSVATGPITIPLSDLVSILLGQQTGTGARVVWNIRLPRIVAAVGAGAGLAVAGAVLQSVLRNPLASPYTLGISQGAAFGAAFSIVVLGTGTTNDGGPILSVIDPYTTAASAFVGAIISALAIFAIAKYRDASPETLILAGIALAALYTAGTTTLEYFATNTELATLVFWKFGDVGSATWEFNVLLWVVVVLVALYVTRRAWAYTVLSAGDETARSLGISVERVRLLGMLLASFVTAVVVAMFGIIGFVGLVVPHIVRRAIGGDERILLPASTVTGGALLLAADTVARTALSPIILPVGIVTSFLGVPLFLYLILKGREYW